jgi:hypothetical protein
MLERLSFQQLHSDEMLTVGFVDFVNRADVRMIERGGSEGFPLEPFTSSRIVLHFYRQKLQRDMPVQLEVFCFVHHTHAAATELFHDAVVRDRLADHGAKAERSHLAKQVGETRVGRSGRRLLSRNNELRGRGFAMLQQDSTEFLRLVKHNHMAARHRQRPPALCLRLLVERLKW